LSNKQFGFIKGRSTSLQLLQIIDKWTKLLENGCQVDVIYTDLEKAFDKIPHKRLISKLSTYGINKDIISWIKAFLNNRKQRVHIKGILSDWVPEGSGIPQRSLLGQILFIIYINDVVEHVNYLSDLYLYADDAKLFYSIKTMEDSAMLQKDLSSLTQWMETWLLRLNIGKCKAISYSRRPELNTNYSISGVTVENI